MRLLDSTGPGLSRSGGAGPSDHKAVEIEGHVLMVPIFTHSSAFSPYAARLEVSGATLERNGKPLAKLRFTEIPRFYQGATGDGVPYWKIATLHAKDVLATTVLQTCTRYGNRDTSCQFCAIGQSLASKTTIAQKTPAQLAEVAEAAVRLDSVQHMVMTTGTPATADRGARVLRDAAKAVRQRVELPIQAQCEPPQDFSWFERLADGGVDSLGMHLEAVSQQVRTKIMPGKAEVQLEYYFSAFEAAVKVFGRGQVSTYILAGLGDSEEEILLACDELIAVGVYPFVVPFVPIAETPLQYHPQPDPAFLHSLLDGVAQRLSKAKMRASHIKAGCGRCGACSSLRPREAARA